MRFADARSEEEELLRCRPPDGGPLRLVAEPGEELEVIGGPFDGAQVASITALYDGSILLVEGYSHIVQPDGRRAIYLSPSVLP